ncbi:aldo/keto reductase [Streptomyces niveus]|uniref:aldo/keto reductase n=1 Tax=Streptomyces niveus TaxID=193462 RepID=UPI0034237338
MRTAPNVWTPHGHPVYRRGLHRGDALRRLDVERLELGHPHRIDPQVPLADQLGTLAATRTEGKLDHIGVSKVTAELSSWRERRSPSLPCKTYSTSTTDTTPSWNCAAARRFPTSPTVTPTPALWRYIGACR